MMLEPCLQCLEGMLDRGLRAIKHSLVSRGIDGKEVQNRPIEVLQTVRQEGVGSHLPCLDRT